MYFSNSNQENFKRLVESLGYSYSDKISDAGFVYIDLEDFIFYDNPKLNFQNHKLSSRDLIDRFNKLLFAFSEFEKNHSGKKQFRFLNFKIDDVKSLGDEELLRWSFYNHKYASSKGLDLDALNEWHSLEKTLDINKIASFKARRENNIALFMHVIKNHNFFSEILIGSIPAQVKNEMQFGLDIAEEKYIHKIIAENNASRIVKVVDDCLDDPYLNFVKQQLAFKKLNFNSTIISNSKKMDKYILVSIRNIFRYLNIQEVSIDNCDFAFLVNDLDGVDLIPLVDTEQPIFAIDLASEDNPNFSYLLLKDDGFSQVYGYSKNFDNEKVEYAFIRSVCSGLGLYLLNRKFSEQIAVNYVDNYFKPLAKSLGKTLAEFKGPLDTLTEKLES
jgi:hypothetical protein